MSQRFNFSVASVTFNVSQFVVTVVLDKSSSLLYDIPLTSYNIIT